MRGPLLCFLFFCVHFSYPQSSISKLATAFGRLQKDSQLKHAAVSLCVMDAKTGRIVFARNEQLGLAPASCQKIFTSIAAFEILGTDYRYKTELSYSGNIIAGNLQGDIYLVGHGDPSLGSWRFLQTRDTVLIRKFYEAMTLAGIQKIAGKIIAVGNSFETQGTPDGWIWQDIGNYYGAGCWGLNWHENQYDLTLQSGNAQGDPVRVLDIEPAIRTDLLVNELKTGSPGSGDNAYIYLPPDNFNGFLRGTIPPGAKEFVVSGSFNVPMEQGPRALAEYVFKKSGIRPGFSTLPPGAQTPQSTLLCQVLSPSLDSLNYWFLKKSINLYGEAFLKTLAYEKAGLGSTAKGVDIIREFWNNQGIEKSALNIIDGSGLSPQNRVTAESLVRALQYAQTRPWFKFFYEALPQINLMKMKSGYISGARSYAGYQKSHDGHDYVFSVIVNNYDGDSEEVSKKIFKVLDNLK